MFLRRLYLLLLIVLILVGCVSEEAKENQIMDNLVMGRYEEARDLVRRYYGENEVKALSWMMSISEFEGQMYVGKLVIQEGWEWVRKRNYTYVRGRVKNTGNKTVRYFKISAHYMNDSGEVIDTDYTNSGETLMPEMAKEFEIMHRYSPEYKRVSICVEEVSLD